MFKKAILLFIGILGGISGFAEILETRPVGPGIIFYREYLAQGPWQLQVLEIDLDNPHVRLESIKAADQLWGYEQTSHMAARSDAEAHRVVGAINADFFSSGGIPVGAQVINGHLLKRETTRSTFGVGPDNQPFIGILSFSGSVSKSAVMVHTVNQVNAARESNQLAVYNRLFGTATGTNNWGTEVICQWLDSPLVNSVQRAVVLAKDSSMAAGSGNNLIPANGFVLSGHGTAQAALDSTLFMGDTLTLSLNFAPIEHPITQLVGGTPRMIRNGSISIETAQEGVAASFSTDRHPRTAVGFTADSSKVYFFTVDGRQPGYSVGMSLPELANYMLGWGVAEGVNLDGGGSTTMVVRGDIMNSPSDATGERTVANALMVVNTAPTGALAIVDVQPADFYTLVGTTQQMSMQGFDSTYNPVGLGTENIIWSCEPSIGSIDAAGMFVAGELAGLGYIIGEVGSLQDTAWVTVTQVDNILLTPDPVVLEVGQHQQMQARALDDQGHLLNLVNTDFEWWVTPGIGVITDLGYFSAENYGSGMIRARYAGISDSVTASVGSSQAVTFDAFNATDNWNLTGLVVDIAQCGLTIDTSIYVSPPSSGRLNYSFTTGGTSVLYLNCEIPISGTPETVFLDIFGDGAGHWMRGEFRCASGDKFLVNFTSADPGIDWIGSWQTVELPLAEATAHWGNPNATLNFPITWTKLYLAEPDDANKNTGVIYLDNFGVSYLTTDTRETIINPQTLKLTGPYPNPFNPATTFHFEIPRTGILELTIYDLNGRIVQQTRLAVDAGSLQYTWQAHQNASGLYLFQAVLGTELCMGKCLLLK